MFRPCIDLRDGKVVQIVGGTLGNDPTAVRTNFVSERPAAWFWNSTKRDGLTGGHVIMLGAGNDAEARAALAAYPADCRSAAVLMRPTLVVGSTLERRTSSSPVGCSAMAKWLGAPRRPCETRQREPLVLDPAAAGSAMRYYFVVTDRWQKFTDVSLSAAALEKFSHSCCRFWFTPWMKDFCRKLTVNWFPDWVVATIRSPTPVVHSLGDLEQSRDSGQGRLA